MSFKFVQLVGALFLGGLALVLLASCGTVWRAHYSSPKFGDAAVEVKLPQKAKGYAK